MHPASCVKMLQSQRHFPSMDKRDHYRIEDAIQVSYKVVTANEEANTPVGEHFGLSPAFRASREIHELELEAVEILRGINENNRQLGSFLHNLNRRISLLTRSLLADELEDDEPLPATTTLSEGGLSFLDEQFIRPETRLALKLLFTPSLLGIAGYGRVIHCRLTDAGADYRVGVQFTRLEEASRRLIARHIIRQQAIERRERLRQSFHE